jgi:hypothetical protein
VLRLSPEERKLLLRSVGTHRSERSLSPIEVAELLQKAVAAGSKRQECSAELQIGPTQIATFLRLLDLAPQIRHLADWGSTSASTIAFSSLAELSRLQFDQQIKAATAMLEHKLSWKEAVQLAQISQRSRRPIEDSINAVVKLRPDIERRHLFVGAIPSEDLRRSIKMISHKERDAIFQSVLNETFGEEPGFSGRLGERHFSIIGPHSAHTVLGMQPDELERQLSDKLLDVIGKYAASN